MKTNPIQTQSNPIKANKMPKQTQFKPNTNPNKANFTSAQKPATAVRCRISALGPPSYVHERDEKNRSPRPLIDPMLPLYTVRKPAFRKGVIFSTNLRNGGFFNTPSEISNGVYKTADEQYYSRRKCRCSSMVEHSFRKAGVVSSTLTIGCVNLQEKYNSLQEILKELAKVVVAYSGGVDSTFLLKAAVDTLGADNVLACISAGVAEPSNQLKRASDQAKSIGAELQVIETDELENPEFTANKADRCFHCKSHICRILLDIAKEKGFGHVVFGTNYDDLDDFRPGNRAMKVFGVRSPLAETKLTKDDIRQLSREMNLPTADLPSSPCLASRIAYGLEVTEQRLKQIDEAEEFLRQLGLVEFRVRHHDTIARIEVNPQDIDKVTKEPNRSKIIEKLKSLGFKFITVDLQGFRSGSLNEPLSEHEKQNL